MKITPQQLSVILEQFKALRDEIIWINSAKFLILQAKYIWIAGVITIIGSAFAIFKDKFHVRKKRELLGIILVFFLFSLLPFDFTLEWLNCQVNEIREYINIEIEPKLKTITNDIKLIYWEEFFKNKHGVYLSLALVFSTIIPLLFAWCVIMFGDIYSMSFGH